MLVGWDPGVLVKARWDHRRATDFQHVYPKEGLIFVTVHPYIEDDRVLFFTRKLPISAKEGHFFGLASGKIGMRGDILET